MAIARILLRGGTSADWAAANPVLAAREIAVDTTLKRVKVGDGQTAWGSLPWVTMSAAEVARLEAAAAALEESSSPTDASIAAQLGAAGSASRAASTDIVDERLGALPSGTLAIATTAGLPEALAGKAADSAVVKLSGNQTVAGVKTFSSPPVVPDGSYAIAKVSGLSTALTAKADLVSGVIPTSQIPAVALVNSTQVASRAAMLALTSSQVQPGDVAVDTSTGSTRGTYMLKGTDPSNINNWVQLVAPTDPVQSVNGQQGIIVLAAADVGAAPASGLNTTNTRVAALETSSARVIYSEKQPATWPAGYEWGQLLTAPPQDTTPPAVPALNDITLTSDNKPHISLVSAVADAVKYNFYRGGLIKGTSDSTSFDDDSADPSTTYTYTATSVDYVGNESDPSAPKLITTQAPSFGNRPDLALDFDPHLLAGSDASNVSEISQSAGFLSCTLAMATVAAQPKLKVNGLNGRKTIVHDAANSQSLQGGLSTAINGSSTIYFIVKETVANGLVRTLLTGINATPYRGISAVVNGTGATRTRATAPGSTYDSTTARAQGAFRVIALVMNADGTGVLYDHARTGQAFTFTATDLGSAIASLRIARAAGSSSTYTSLEWARLLVFNSAHTATEIAAGMTYADNFYALTTGS